MTGLTRAESLRAAIEALISQDKLDVGLGGHVARAESACRQAIEQLTGDRAQALTLHEVSVLFGLSETRLKRNWLVAYRKTHPERVRITATGEQLYRLDDMVALREEHRMKAATAPDRAAEARWGANDVRWKRKTRNDLDELRRQFKEAGTAKAQAALPHIEALRDLCAFVDRCTHSSVFATTEPLTFMVNADGLVVDSGDWCVMNREAIAELLRAGGSLVGLTLHDALGLAWTDVERREVWMKLWHAGVTGSERLMNEGQAQGRAAKGQAHPVHGQNRSRLAR